jgi:hypothetical protein
VKAADAPTPKDAESRGPRPELLHFHSSRIAALVVRMPRVLLAARAVVRSRPADVLLAWNRAHSSLGFRASLSNALFQLVPGASSPLSGLFRRQARGAGTCGQHDRSSREAALTPAVCGSGRTSRTNGYGAHCGTLERGTRVRLRFRVKATARNPQVFGFPALTAYTPPAPAPQRPSGSSKLTAAAPPPRPAAPSPRPRPARPGPSGRAGRRTRGPRRRPCPRR